MRFSDKEKDIITVLVDKGHGARNISEEQNLHRIFVQDIISRCKKSESMENESINCGIKRVIDDRIDRVIVRSVTASAEKRRKSSIEFQEELSEDGIIVSSRTFENVQPRVIQEITLQQKYPRTEKEYKMLI